MRSVSISRSLNASLLILVALCTTLTSCLEGRYKLKLKGKVRGLATPTTNEVDKSKSTFDQQGPIFSFVSINRSYPDFTSNTAARININLSEDAAVTLYIDEACSAAVSTTQKLNAGNNVAVVMDQLGIASNGYLYAQAIDNQGNASRCIKLVNYGHIMALEDPNPSVGNNFGQKTLELSNGNIVVTSPNADIYGVNDSGAVYLFDGKTGFLISSLYGTSASDQVGTDITSLANGNFVVSSEDWDCSIPNGCGASTSDVGAATLVNGISGLNGPVSFSNSYVGFSSSDLVANQRILALTNGNFVIVSSSWDCAIARGCVADVVDVGAATFVNGVTGGSGYVSISNSLVGSTAYDWVGLNGYSAALSNGNYVIASFRWNCRITSGCAADVNQVGAATWGNGTTGITGYVSFSNSLVGSSTNDRIAVPVTPLTNGNYVVGSPTWNATIVRGCAANTATVGAATWANGATGLTGYVSCSNSLVGRTAGDNITRRGMGGLSNIKALANGHYIVPSPSWDCSIAAGCGANTIDVGAVTWGDGFNGTIGLVSFSNSLVGFTAYDQVGYEIVPLAINNYLVLSRYWDCAIARGCSANTVDVGAVTLANGTDGSTNGYVGASNSMFGSNASDEVGQLAYPLTGHDGFVFVSSSLDCTVAQGCSGTIVDAGAATYGRSGTSFSGAVSSSNSLVGSSAFDQVGSAGVIGLTNGNFIIQSPHVDCTLTIGCNSASVDVGAISWGEGSSGISGSISTSNSLLGASVGDSFGYFAGTFANGHYFSWASSFDCTLAIGCSTAYVNAGFLFLGDGAKPTVGQISASLGLYGAQANDEFGSGNINELISNKAVVYSSSLPPTDRRVLMIVPALQPGISGTVTSN